LLNVPQTVLETSYYFVDIPKIIEAARKRDIANRLADIYMRIATNNRSIEEADYKAYIGNLNKSLGIKTEQKFDRDKFEELRALTNMGGNRAR
jgi:CRISPR/Cas system type I-B associated protein Csh2 (Cas7 group RAMP superfamily)